MILPQLLILGLALGPSLSNAALFPPDSLVKVIDAKGFKRAMKQNQTSAVAFVAPWCGHCQRAAPEYSKAAVGLHPMVNLYAVDCDDEKNKRLCGEQGVKGFPTFKLFPRGNQLPPVEFQSERTAGSFFRWISNGIPTRYKTLASVDDIQNWVKTNKKKPRAILLTKDKTTPLLWKTLANKFGDRFSFAHHVDANGKGSTALGVEPGQKNPSKVLIYAPRSTDPARYEGATKYDALSKFFDSVLDGTADLKVVKSQPKEAIIVEEKTEKTIPVEVESDQVVLEAVPEKEAVKETVTVETTSTSSDEPGSTIHESVTEVPEPPEPEPSPSVVEKERMERPEDEL